MVVRTALRGADALVALGRVDEAEWIVRKALQLSPYDERLYRALLRTMEAQGNRIRLHAAMAQLQTLAGEAVAERAAGRSGRRRTACIPRRRRSTVTCCGGRLPREGTPPGCRVATRHGEKLFWEIGRPRRRNGRWHHLSRADARELVCRARHHRHRRAGLDCLGQVQLQQGPGGRGADGRDVVARRARLRHLRHHGIGTTRLAHLGQDRADDDGRRGRSSSHRRAPARPGTTPPSASSPTGTAG